MGTVWPSYGHGYNTYTFPSYGYTGYTTYNSFVPRRVYSPRVVLPSVKAVPVVSNPVVAAPLIKTVSTNNDFQSPSAQAALSYIQENVGLDTCGEQAKEYINVVANGGSREEAAAIATQVYQRNHVGRAALSPACLAAEVAWKNAVAVGRDPVLDSALAFMDASPSESPCYVSARDYVSAIANGAQHTEANLLSAKAFINQIVNLEKQGKPTVDPTCARSALAYATKSAIPSTPNAAAMTAFINKSLEVGSSFDPVCLSSINAYIDAFLTGAGEGAANEAAAVAYINAVEANPSFDAKSPCGQAAETYIANFK